MARMLTEKRLFIATHNPGKAKEFNTLFRPSGVDARNIAGLGLEDSEETGKTFHENAAIKALFVARATGEPAMADDSGLCVSALGDQPGIYSGRWAEKTPDGPRDFEYAMERLRLALVEVGDEDARARFVAVLCLAWPDGHCEYFEGAVHGRLTFPAKGEAGFGYDPIFTPDGYDQSFAQMSFEEKNALSHRLVAFEKLKEAISVDP